MVLYSRLYLVSSNPRLLKTVLYTIITTALIFNIPNFLIDSLPGLRRDKIFLQINYGFNAVFALQEIILSLLYIFLFYRFAGGGGGKVNFMSKRDETTFHLLIFT